MNVLTLLLPVLDDLRQVRLTENTLKCVRQLTKQIQASEDQVRVIANRTGLGVLWYAKGDREALFELRDELSLFLDSLNVACHAAVLYRLEPMHHRAAAHVNRAMKQLKAASRDDLAFGYDLLVFLAAAAVYAWLEYTHAVPWPPAVPEWARACVFLLVLCVAWQFRTQPVLKNPEDGFALLTSLVCVVAGLVWILAQEQQQLEKRAPTLLQMLTFPLPFYA